MAYDYQRMQETSTGGLRALLREHTLVFGFMAALVPLSILMVVQVFWLTELDQASAVTRQVALRNYLDAVATKVTHFYRSTSERLLNVPASPFGGTIEELGAYWRARPRQGVRRLFAIDYSKTPTGNFYTFVPEEGTMIQTPSSNESLAIVLAALSWQRFRNPQKLTAPPAIHVNEQDPKYRMILKPVTGEGGRVAGLVGLILDEEYVRAQLLPRIVDKVRPAFFVDEDEDHVMLTVEDPNGKLIFGADRPSSATDTASIRMPFVLRHWTLSVHQTAPARPKWGSLSYNLGVGAILALALIGGLWLALRSAHHAMRLSQMKSDFVSNVSHELRTPLASIRVFAELMKHGKVRDSKKVVEYGTYIEKESRRLSRLIDNILEFSRIESRQKTYRRSPTPIVDVLEPVLQVFSVRLQQSGLRLESELPRGPGPIVTLDPDAVGQALHNLLDNAAKYSEPETVVSVKIRTESEHVIISVQDQGCGIAPADQAKVFERFHRVSTGLVHDVKGCGLGLSIVEHTARAHGGRVTVDSALGQGSTFSLWLPYSSGAEHV